MCYQFNLILITTIWSSSTFIHDFGSLSVCAYSSTLREETKYWNACCREWSSCCLHFDSYSFLNLFWCKYLLFFFYKWPKHYVDENYLVAVQHHVRITSFIFYCSILGKIKNFYFRTTLLDKHPTSV